MPRSWAPYLAGITLAVTLPLCGRAQESTVKGAISGLVLDTTGAVIPGAQVRLTGPTGSRVTTSDSSGNFDFLLLIPGLYSVAVEKPDFKTAVASEIQVFVNQTSAVRITLQPGAITQTITVTAGAQAVDTTSTTAGDNLNDVFFQKIPIRRNVADIFYIAAGVASGLGTGFANPSISGGTGLENQYVADGVDLTDTGFGGIGIFSRIYGPLATGINLAFLQEVQVKTAGFEPQYGKATGGIIQIVTKSGGREYHGAVNAYYQPHEFEAARRNPDDFARFNKLGDLVHVQQADLSGEMGGYFPSLRDHLFFFASMDPSEVLREVKAPPSLGLGLLGDLNRRTLTYNYAFKGTWRINDRHQIESSIFGDPSHTNRSAFRTLTEGMPGIPNTTAFSKLDLGTRDWAVRYNGTLSTNWLVNASFTWGHNSFTEKEFDNRFQEILDQTQTAGLPGQVGQFTDEGLGLVEDTIGEAFKVNIDTTKIFHLRGEHSFSIGYELQRSFYDGLVTLSGPNARVPANNAVGDGITGTCMGVPIGCMTFSQVASTSPAVWNWRLQIAPPSCTLCPFANVPGIGTSQVYLSALQVLFGVNPDSGGLPFSTNGTYHSAHLNDSWTLNKRFSINAGLRWEIQRLEGQAAAYEFTDNWSPRVGMAVDPRGDRKSKIFANFGRYTYALPLDLAERSLTNMPGLAGFNLAPAFKVNASGQRILAPDQFGSPVPVIDAAHVINTDQGGIPGFTFASLNSTEAFAPGTKMTYEDEWLLGVEHEFPHGVIFSAKYIRRDLERIVEDTSGIQPEAALAGVAQQFVIANPGAGTDIFVNPIEFVVPAFTPPGRLPSQCLVRGAPVFYDPAVTNNFGNILGGACFEPFTNLSTGTVIPAACQANNSNNLAGRAIPGAAANSVLPGCAIPDGMPDGFVGPARAYWAVEFEANKSFSRNWQLRANWRIAHLFGNYEGAYRNDNQQSDPGISSLFDFTPGKFNLLGDQLRPGVLNTDRLHIVNVYFTYTLDRSWGKGLDLGWGIRAQSGIPLNNFKAHPVYGTPGEVPVGGRGALGRSPSTATVDFHADYPMRLTEKSRLRFAADFFNLANSSRLLYIDQNEDLFFGVPNIDFKKPANIATLGDAFGSPFAARISLQFEF